MLLSPRFRSLLVATLTGAGVYALASIAACDDGAARTPTKSSDPTTLVSDAGPFTRSDLLAQIGQCALDGYRRASETTGALAVAVRAYAAAPTETSLATARSAFTAAMPDYERIELLQFGPFGPKTAPGGAGLRDLVYSWPNSSRCLIDETIVDRSYENDDFPAKGLVSARGLYALEYLLFHDGPNACLPNAAINAEGLWDGVGAEERARRRAKYAAIVADDVAARLSDVVQRWDASGGNFLGELATAGKGSRHFGSEQVALNSVMDALFYVDLDLKDAKLGRPLGLKGGCAQDCATEAEAPYSKLGKAHLTANFAGFRDVFFGCGEGHAGLGFDDLLVGLGAGQAATDVQGALDEIDAALAAIPDGQLEVGLATKSAQAQALHAAVSKLGDRLRTEIVTVLNLELPARVEGDND